MVFLPRLLAHRKSTAPGVRLRALPIPLRAQEAALESGEVDLAIGHFTAFAGGFHQRRLFRESYVCVARSDHPRFARGMSVEAFSRAEHAYADASGMAHELVEQVLRQHGIARRVSLTVPQFMVLPLVIAGSDLLVTMPGRLAEEFAKLIRIKVMPFPVRMPGYDIKLLLAPPRAQRTGQQNGCGAATPACSRTTRPRPAARERLTGAGATASRRQRILTALSRPRRLRRAAAGFSIALESNPGFSHPRLPRATFTHERG